MVVIQSDAFNRSRIQTVIVGVITSNTRLSAAPGNVRLTTRQSGLAKESVINVSQLITLDKSYLRDRVSQLPSSKLEELDVGVRLVLDL